MSYERVSQLWATVPEGLLVAVDLASRRELWALTVWSNGIINQIMTRNMLGAIRLPDELSRHGGRARGRVCQLEGGRLRLVLCDVRGERVLRDAGEEAAVLPIHRREHDAGAPPGRPVGRQGLEHSGAGQRQRDVHPAELMLCRGRSGEGDPAGGAGACNNRES